MDRLLWLPWAWVQWQVLMLLAEGMDHPADLVIFLICHGIAIIFSFGIFFPAIRRDPLFEQKLSGRGVGYFLGAVALPPLIGPSVLLVLLVFLRHYPLRPLRAELYHCVDSDFMMVMEKKSRGPAIPVIEALLTSGLDREKSFRLIEILSKTEWSAVKSGILRYLIRLSPYQNVVFMAINLLRQKTDALLSEIARLEKKAGESGPARHRRIATLYHELGYLDLSDPVITPLYRQKACAFAAAVYRMSGTEADALLAVRYLLEADSVREAWEIYREVAGRGEYASHRWLPYEFEMAVRRNEKTLFEDLYGVIELGDGVFVPAKVKEAAKAWKRVLTSAWL